MKSVLVLNVWVAALIVCGANVQAVPVESGVDMLVAANTTTTPTSSESTINNATNAANVTKSLPTHPETQEIETTGTTLKQQENGNFVGTVGTEVVPDQVAAESHFDPSIYSGFFSPDAFQHYMNQFGAAYAPYGGAAYPAPVGYAPPPPAYHSPYSVQTGYEGYLVPGDESTSSNTAIDASSTSLLPSLLNPLALIGNLFPALMMSTAFRVIAAIVSMIGMVLFGGAITTAICNLTPICDISFKAVTYLKRRGTAERVSRMIADEMTPERMRRATEFVHNAIRKYRDMQRLQGVALSEGK